MNRIGEITIIQNPVDYLSIAYPVSFVHKGVTMRSVLQAALAEKALFFNELAMYERMLSAQTVQECLDIASSGPKYPAERWAAVCEGVLLSIWLSRFDSDSQGLAMLRDTGDTALLMQTDPEWLGIDNEVDEIKAGNSLQVVRIIRCFNRNMF